MLSLSLRCLSNTSSKAVLLLVLKGEECNPKYLSLFKTSSEAKIIPNKTAVDEHVTLTYERLTIWMTKEIFYDVHQA